MEDEYIIVNITAIQKKIEELETEYALETEELMKEWFLGKIEALEQILSQSTPLIPEIEKAWEMGAAYGTAEDDILPESVEAQKNYISNLKIEL